MARFRLLIDAGADVHKRNDIGQTCLQRCVARACRPQPREWNPLLFLVRNGSKVRSIDNEGRSVREIAYESKLNLWDYHDTGSYKGDLLDVVLTRCGYDIRRMRQGFPRTPEYSTRYTRQVFQMMWEGKEQLCPYYDDPPVWNAPEIPHFKPLDDENEKILAAQVGIVDDGAYYDEDDYNGEEQGGWPS